MRWKEDTTQYVGLSMEVMVWAVELGAVLWEVTLDWYTLLNLAVGVWMGWRLMLSNGKGPELVQANEPCCRNKDGMELSVIQWEGT
jgi:hypothetical protein